MSKLLLTLFTTVVIAMPVWAEDQPVLIGLDGEFGLPDSTSAQSIEMGMKVAIAEINASGGVLGGRPLQLVTRDNRSMPARAVRNMEAFADMPDLVAVVTGRFSPAVLESLPTIHAKKLPTLAAWSAANGIVDNDYEPNFVFRLSLKDAFAMPAMLDYAKAHHKAKRVGLLLTNTAWGRSNLATAERYIAANPELSISGTMWYNWLDKSLIDKYQQLRRGGAELVVLVGNDTEGSILLNEVDGLPEAEHLPIVSHWGITGGKFFENLRDPAVLDKVGFRVVQTFSFFTSKPERVAAVMRSTSKVLNIQDPADIPSPVGFGHAYDLVHILAKAINEAGNTDRATIQQTLLRVKNYAGLVDDFDQPFSPGRQEALGPKHIFMARYDEKGVIRSDKP